MEVNVCPVCERKFYKRDDVVKQFSTIHKNQLKDKDIMVSDLLTEEEKKMIVRSEQL